MSGTAAVSNLSATHRSDCNLVDNVERFPRGRGLKYRRDNNLVTLIRGGPRFLSYILRSTSVPDITKNWPDGIIG